MAKNASIANGRCNFYQYKLSVLSCGIRVMEEKEYMKTKSHFLARWYMWYRLHSKKEHIFFHPWEIRYAHIGCNIGNEVDGKAKFLRPIFILQRVWSMIRCLALTSKDKEWKFYYKLSEWSSVILSDIRSIDSKRLLKKTGRIETDILIGIKKIVSQLLG